MTSERVSAVGSVSLSADSFVEREREGQTDRAVIVRLNLRIVIYVM